MKGVGNWSKNKRGKAVEVTLCSSQVRQAIGVTQEPTGAESEVRNHFFSEFIGLGVWCKRRVEVPEPAGG